MDVMSTSAASADGGEPAHQPSVLNKEPHRKSDDAPAALVDLEHDPLTELPLSMLSVHGLVRGESMELGRDPDTGGQVKYVVELARALSQIHPVYRVDLITRLIDDPKVDRSYAEPVERIAPGGGELGGAFIVRLPFGPRGRYLHKEALWPHLRELADRAVAHCRSTLVALGQERHCRLYAVHGHYADAGDAAAVISAMLGADMVFTGHSLGRNKLDHLLKSGTMSRAEIDSTYMINRRIEGEERALDSSLMVLTSTQEEVEKQWSLYHGYDTELEKALRLKRNAARAVPMMAVIPPGLDFSYNQWVPDCIKAMCQPADGAGDPDSCAASKSSGSGSGQSAVVADSEAEHEAQAVPQRPEPAFWPHVFRFLNNPHKPAILAMSRPDAKKNIMTLIKAFGESPVLREICNLVLIMGNRDDIDSMAKGSANILTTVLKLIDKYDLYGSVAYPKRHRQTDISDIYHLPYATRGVFTNIAWQEPFGLTLIEAAAHGVPIVATKHGGPNDIIATLQNGVLVDPAKPQEIADACISIVTQQDTWDMFSASGIKNIHAYSWPSHCQTFLRYVEKCKWLAAVRNGKTDDNLLPVKAVQMDRSHTGPFPDDAAKVAAELSQQDPSPQNMVNSVNSNAAACPKPEGSSSDAEFHSLTAVFADTEGGIPLAASVVASAPKGTAIVLATFLDLSSARVALHNNCGVAVGGVHAIVTRGGAEVWVWSAEKQEYVFDDTYEKHVQFRWDAKTARRGLNFLRQKALETKAASGRSRGRWLDLLRSWAGLNSGQTHGVAEEDERHPHHVKMIMALEGNATDSIIDIRGKLRIKGIRANLTLSYSSNDGAVTVHVTPVRASRALAVRHIAIRLGLGFEGLKHVVSVEATREGHILGRSSDLMDNLGGMQPVLVSRPSESHSQGDVGEFAFEADAGLFGDRIMIVNDSEAMESSLSKFLES
uniref:sucrose-phosphate synthase n=1 Tax=Tetraselmis sp. GSL018 TaxID=582737 RepID=A0A061RVG0_9CHLO